MAFRRFRPFRRVRRSRFRRRFTGRSRGARFARQKFDRIVLFNNLNAGPLPSNNKTGDDTVGNALGVCSPIAAVACSPQDNPPFCGPATICQTIPSDVTCGCCVMEVQFNLINNGTLESFFQDSVTLVRIYGDIWYRALVAFPSFGERCTLQGAVLAAYNEIYAESYMEQWHWSMRKHLRTQSADETTALEAAGPVYDYDWTESSPPWLWQRVKLWEPRNHRSNFSMANDSPIGICANTSQAGYTVPAEASGGQPSYNVPAESTSCTVVQANAGEGGCGPIYDNLATQEPPWHHMRMSFRKHVKMVRDQDLNLTCHVRHPQLTTLGGWNCIPKSSVPTFSRAFDTNYQFYVRLAAVIRLN